MFLSSPLHKERRNQLTNSLTSLLDIAPTVYDWFGIDKEVFSRSKRNLTGKSLLPLLEKGKMILTVKFLMFDIVFLEPTDFTKEAVFGSHNLHEVTMYYPMRMIRTQKYKLIHNLNYKSAFPIDQDSYLSPTFQVRQWLTISVRVKRVRQNHFLGILK